MCNRPSDRRHQRQVSFGPRHVKCISAPAKLTRTLVSLNFRCLMFSKIGKGEFTLLCGPPLSTRALITEQMNLFDMFDYL